MAARRASARKSSWVRRVAERSDAMDLPRGIFRGSAAQIARGLKRSALRSGRTKGTKLQSAMGMLNLYINRAGRKLAPSARARLERAKEELRKQFGGRERGRKRTTKRGGKSARTTSRSSRRRRSPSSAG